MRLREVILLWYRSVDYLEFGLGPFTVLFGKNNAGKTNVLEAIYGILAPYDMPSVLAEDAPARGVRGADDLLPPTGAVYVELEQGFEFDDEVLARGPGEAHPLLGEFVTVDATRLPPLHVSFIGVLDKPSLLFADPRDYLVRFRADAIDGRDDHELDEQFGCLCIEGPRPRALFLNWEFNDIDDRVGAAIVGPLLDDPWEESGKSGWLEPVDAAEPGGAWRVRPEIINRVDQFASLATDLLPDFIDGSIRAHFHIPTTWGASPRVSVEFEERGSGQRADIIAALGRGSARWVAVAAQVALHLLAHNGDLTTLRGAGPKAFSGHVLFVDEPEAHLHASATASIVRWCQRMVDNGFHVVVASHHEEFLRASGDHVTLVHVTRDAERSRTRARTLLSAATPLLQELATEVGMHPASVLSLHRAILFVEGPLDEAVLDEYGAPALDAAGVTIVPIHGTKNLEGLIDAELTTRLGIKMGVLTDATDTATMWDRSKKKRSGEERKLIRLIEMFESKGLPPPTAFGVPEDDLLFALPADGIRDYLDEVMPGHSARFPGWRELRQECRDALGKGPSDSVDWKSYAEEHYGLPITTTTGVRSVVRALDMANVPLPSIRKVIDQVINWAR